MGSFQAEAFDTCSEPYPTGSSSETESAISPDKSPETGYCAFARRSRSAMDNLLILACNDRGLCGVKDHRCKPVEPLKLISPCCALCRYPFWKRTPEEAASRLTRTVRHWLPCTSKFAADSWPWIRGSVVGPVICPVKCAAPWRSYGGALL